MAAEYTIEHDPSRIAALLLIGLRSANHEEDADHTNVPKIATALGLTINPWIRETTPDHKELSGFVVYRKDTGFKAYMATDTPDRIQNMVMAIILGLYLLHDHTSEEDEGYLLSNTIRDCAHSDKAKKRWAYRFMQSLILPAENMRLYWASGKTLNELASIFQVPTWLIHQRLNQLSLY